MNPAAALVLAASLATATEDDLAPARAAFEAGDYARAAELALEAAGATAEAPEMAGARDDALYLAGLARFRDGRAAEALDLLDRSGPRADGPDKWSYNRGACLDALGRYEEAERAFLLAASDPALTLVALVNAGYAALSRGAPDVAGAHAATARAAPGDALDLVDGLDRDIAVAEAGAAGGVPPGPDGSRSRRWIATGRIEGGHDSNALQSGASSPGDRTAAAPGPAASALAVTDVVAIARFRPAGLDLDATYGFSQLAYSAPGARDRSIQQHGGSLALEGEATDGLVLGGAAEGQLAYAGLTGFRGMQRSAGLRAWAILAEGDATSTRLDLAWARKQGVGLEFAYLSGDRLEAALSQLLRLGPTVLSLGVRLAADRIGEGSEALTCGEDCTATAFLPVGHAGPTAWLAVRWSPLRHLRLDLSGAVEWRRYLADDRLVVDGGHGPPVETWHARREDRRVLASALATAEITRSISLFLRGEQVVDRSNLASASVPCIASEDACVPASAGDPSYSKRVLSAGAALAW